MGISEDVLQGTEPTDDSIQNIIASIEFKKEVDHGVTARGIVEYNKQAGIIERIVPPSKAGAITKYTRRKKPTWHAPWKLKNVISGHTGWVRCVDVEPGNEWFCTGAADRTIKLWDLASGTLKLTLTGHIATVSSQSWTLIYM
jgi:pleiotropic regulator 1